MHNFYFSNNINTKWFIFFGLILHVLASYFTVGYYNADEHYQVIGPLEKLLNIDNKLTWEFDYRIRPWLQPYFYFVITKTLSLLHLNNPFVIAFDHIKSHHKNFPRCARPGLCGVTEILMKKMWRN